MPNQNITMYTKYAFLIGLIIVILNGFIYYNVDLTIKIIVALVVGIIGVVVGFLQITKEHEVPFLVGVITLLVIGTGGLMAVQVVKELADVEAVLPFYAVAPTVGYLGVLLGPAAIIVALKLIFRSTGVRA